MSDTRGERRGRIPFSIVIPAHNEENRIGGSLAVLLRDLDGTDCSEILVADDSSTDHTLEIVERVAFDRSPSILVRSIRVDSGRGKGAAIRAGVASAQSEVVVLLDADLPVSADELIELACRTDLADLVLGSRRIDGASFEVPQPFARRLGGLLFRTCARALGFRGGSDPQCGAKALRVARLGPIVAECVSDDFALDAELIERSRRRGCSISEMPVRWRHQPGSTVRPLRDFFRTVRSLRAAQSSVRACVASPSSVPDCVSTADAAPASCSVTRPSETIRGA